MSPYLYTGTPAVAGEGFIYVVGFGTNPESIKRIKVGMTDKLDPAQRVNVIRKTRGYLGLPASFIWVSPPHIHNDWNETALLEWCAAQYDDDYEAWPPWGREYFDDLDPSAVVAHAMTLPMQRWQPPVVGWGQTSRSAAIRRNRALREALKSA